VDEAVVQLSWANPPVRSHVEGLSFSLDEQIIHLANIRMNYALCHILTILSHQHLFSSRHERKKGVGGRTALNLSRINWTVLRLHRTNCFVCVVAKYIAGGFNRRAFSDAVLERASVRRNVPFS
jgi:hypothetical protein